ncbi:MAG: phosphoribosyl-AMP cyclohydrolase [Methanobacterium sp.]|uniref:phosphoribosyl-AMP cyclohydrolase n=1 Tax=Methanobacterium sp. TaxID=2164 RepID=UPI003D661B78|nr:phosphoribosyl-AMP cyclohydrolase [Methanobacterium sp.]
MDIGESNLNFRHKIGDQDLIIAIAQDYKSNKVLMVAYMNREAFQKTVETKKAHYWSTSRQKLWLKGESSGNFQNVKEIYVDCDEDAVLIKISQKGGACHEGYESCFFRKLENNKLEVVGKKVFNPDEVYKS